MAIIAVLVAIAIPVFGTALDKARSSVCAANRRNLKAELTVDYLSNQKLTGGSTVNDTTGLVTISPELTKTYTCPDKGKISAIQSGDGSFYVDCSIHTSDPVSGLMSVYDTLKSMKQSRFDSNVNKDHSNVLSGNDAYREAVENLGSSAKTWALIKSNSGTPNNTSDDTTYLIWSSYETVNSETGNEYAKIPAIAYDSVKKTYTVGLTSVGTKKLDYTDSTGVSQTDKYPAIALGVESGTFNPDGATTFNSLEKAQAYYETLKPTTK